MTSVITGDIINSRKVIDQGLWLNPLKDCLNYITEDSSNYEIFRGDSFQIEINNIEECFKTAIYIKACIKSIKGFNVRIAIGIGDKTYRAHSVSESSGSAFLNSGGLLDFMKRTKINLRIKSDFQTKIYYHQYDFDKIFNLYFRFASVLMDNWTTNSAEAVKILIESGFKNQETIGKKIGLSQDAISKRLKRANIDELLELEEVYKTHINSILS